MSVRIEVSVIDARSRIGISHAQGDLDLGKLSIALFHRVLPLAEVEQVVGTYYLRRSRLMAEKRVMKTHRYAVIVTWTGNTGSGTSNYRAYERRHEISSSAQKPPIPGSSDAAFRGDSTRWNPEELLVAALAACHKLWYLHLCAESGIVVTGYVDHAEGVMEEAADGSGRFQSVILRPKVTVASGSDLVRARELHAAAHAKCFIASSVNFPVRHEAEISTA